MSDKLDLSVFLMGGGGGGVNCLYISDAKLEELKNIRFNIVRLTQTLS